MDVQIRGVLRHSAYTSLILPSFLGGLSWWLGGRESATSGGDEGDVGSVPGLGRSPGEENGNPLPYSCLGNPF